jgi:hypothetical protein
MSGAASTLSTVLTTRSAVPVLRPAPTGAVLTPKKEEEKVKSFHIGVDIPMIPGFTGFSKNEKTKWWETKKKLKIGLIRHKDLDVVVTIFNETFDFSKKLDKETRGVFEPEKCSYKDDNLVTPEQKKHNEEISATLGDVKEELGFNNSGNTPVEISESLQINTTTDFERLYLGWLYADEESSDVNSQGSLSLSPEDIVLKKSVLKGLFRFIFGTQLLNKATPDSIYKKFRIAYTKFEVEEKLPCKGSALWNDFKKSLEYRREQVICEIRAAKVTLGFSNEEENESNQYLELKKHLAIGLRDLLDVLEGESPCFIYGKDDSLIAQEDSDYTDADYVRALQIFNDFVAARKSTGFNKSHWLKELRARFAALRGLRLPSSSIDFASLYEQLLDNLTFTAEAKDFSSLLKENRDLRRVVRHLVIVLNASNEIHSLTLAAKDLLCKLQGCCGKKVEGDEAKVTKEEYETLIKQIEALHIDLARSGASPTGASPTGASPTGVSPKVKRLETLIYNLASLIIKEKLVHGLYHDTNELIRRLHACCEKREILEGIEAETNSTLNNERDILREQLEEIQKALEKSDRGRGKLQQEVKRCKKELRELKNHIPTPAALAASLEPAGGEQYENDFEDEENAASSLSSGLTTNNEDSSGTVASSNVPSLPPLGPGGTGNNESEDNSSLSSGINTNNEGGISPAGEDSVSTPPSTPSNEYESNFNNNSGNSGNSGYSNNFHEEDPANTNKAKEIRSKRLETSDDTNEVNPGGLWGNNNGLQNSTVPVEASGSEIPEEGSGSEIPEEGSGSKSPEEGSGIPVTTSGPENENENENENEKEINDLLTELEDLKTEPGTYGGLVRMFERRKKIQARLRELGYKITDFRGPRGKRPFRGSRSDGIKAANLPGTPNINLNNTKVPAFNIPPRGSVTPAKVGIGLPPLGDTQSEGGKPGEFNDDTKEEGEGTSTESESTGGQPTGGQPTGGQPRGGQPRGGQSTGGQSTGGQSTGGQPTGGEGEPDAETLQDEIAAKKAFTLEKEAELLAIINQQPMEKKVAVTKLLTVSSQQCLGNPRMGLSSDYYNFVGRYLQAKDTSRTLSSPVDDKGYAHQFWGEEGGVKTGRIFKGNPDLGVKELLGITYEMYSTAAIELYKTEGKNIDTSAFLHKIGLKSTIMTEFASHGYSGKSFTNYQGQTREYTNFFDELSNSLVEVAKELIELKILEERLKITPNVPAGYQRFKKIILGSGLSQVIGTRIAYFLKTLLRIREERLKPFHYYLDMLLRMSNDHFNGVKVNLRKLIQPSLNAYRDDRDMSKKQKYINLKKYIDKGYLEKDLEEMYALRKSAPTQRYQVVVPKTKYVDYYKYIWDIPLDGRILQKGGSSEGMPSFAESFLTLLTLEVKSHGLDPEDFVKKAEGTINDMGQLPLVKEFIGQLFDEVKIEDSSGYTFTPFKGDIAALEEALHANFSESEISVLKDLSAPKVFYSAVPEEYESILGEGAYSLDGGPGPGYAEEVELKGVDEDIVVTKEERANLESGGIPLGALIFLYFVCLKMSNSTA